MAEFHLHLFGGVTLRHRGQTISHFGTSRAAKLLVLLASSRTGKMLRTQLADQLWPDDFPDSTRLRLRQEIFRLKQALGDLSEIVGSSHTDVWVDKSRFSTDLETLGSDERVDGFDYYAQEFLPGWDDPWVTLERSRASQLQIAAAKRFLSKLLDAGEAEQVLDLATKFVALHPLNEDLRMTIVHAHAKMGHLAAGLAEYQDYRRVVKSHGNADLPELDHTKIVELALNQPKPKQWNLRSTIPKTIGTLFGRESLMETVHEHLSRSRIVTLVGPGGIGKTRLALEVAHSLSPESAGFVSFAEVSLPEEWVSATLSQLRQDPPPGTDLKSYLFSVLSESPITLIFDNLETVLPSIQESLEELIRSAPDLRLLMTSVQPAKVNGEIVVAVGALDHESSGYEMLTELVRVNRPKLLDDSRARSELLEIVRKLDGYPLAIRLASARLRLLTPANLLERLESSLSNVSTSDLAVRHRSLEAALETTFSMLDETQLATLKRIAAFPDGLSTEMASLAFGDEPYLQYFEELLDLALINLEETNSMVRIKMTWPVRNFVKQSAAGVRWSELERQAAMAILEYVDQFDLAPWKPLPRVCLEQLDPETENMSFAFAWACNADPQLVFSLLPKIVRFDLSRGRAEQLEKRIESLSIQWANEDSATVAQCELCRAFMEIALFREREAIRFLENALLALGELDQPEIRARIQFAFAVCAQRITLDREAFEATKALEMAKVVDDVYLAARIHKVLAQVATSHHDEERTRFHLRQSYLGLMETHSDSEAAAVGTFLSHQLWHAGRSEEAHSLLSECAAVLEQTREPASLAYLREIEGRFAMDEKKPEEAERKFRESLRIWSAIGSVFQIADQCHSITVALVSQQKYGEASEFLFKAADHWHRDQNKGGFCCSMHQAGIISFRTGRVEEAKKILSFAKAFREEHDLLIYKEELRNVSVVYEELGELEPNSLPTTFESGFTLLTLLH